MLSKVHRGALGGGPVRRASSDEKAESPLQKIGGSDSSEVECLLFQMVDYHESEGAHGGKEEQAKSSEEEAANSGPEAKVAKTSEAPRLVT